MPYGFFADAVVVFHFVWILFLIFGGLWGRRHRWAAGVHVAALGFAVLLESLDWFCPLTHLEVWLREKGNQAGYSESFIPHYLNQLIYLEAPHRLIVFLTVAICAANIWLYLAKRKS